MSNKVNFLNYFRLADANEIAELHLAPIGSIAPCCRKSTITGYLIPRDQYKYSGTSFEIIYTIASNGNLYIYDGMALNWDEFSYGVLLDLFESKFSSALTSDEIELLNKLSLKFNGYKLV